MMTNQKTLLKMTKLFPGNDCVKPCTLNWYSGLALYTIYVSVTTPPFMLYVKGHVLITDVLRKLISSIASSECTSGMTSTFLGGCYHVTSNSYWKKSPPHFMKLFQLITHVSIQVDTIE